MNLVVNGVLLHYSETGKPGAPTILMLHGWGSSSAAFAGLASALSLEYRVVLLDLPGFGGSEVPPPDWHVQDYAGAVQAFLDKAEFGQPVAIIGHSFGGRIAIKAVGTGLLKPKRLVLMGSAGVAHHRSLRNRLITAVAKTGKIVTALPGVGPLRARLRRRLYAAAGSTDYLQTTGSMRQILVNTLREDLQADAAAIKIPTLLIWGDLDTETPLADGRLLAAKIPHSRIEVIPHAGHYVFLDAPVPIARFIKEFLA